MDKATQALVIAGLALGSFCACLLVLFAIVAVPALATAGIASAGVFLGIFSAFLVTLSWATQPVSDHFAVWEVA